MEFAPNLFRFMLSSFERTYQSLFVNTLHSKCGKWVEKKGAVDEGRNSRAKQSSMRSIETHSLSVPRISPNNISFAANGFAF